MMFVKVVGIMPEHSCSFAQRAILFSDSFESHHFWHERGLVLIGITS